MVGVIAGAATRREPGEAESTPTATAAAAATPNGAAELARERSVADINMSVGWVPGVGTVFNAMNLASDFVDFTIAALKGDVADMRDEIGDMTLDVIGMVPVIGAPLSATIYRATTPVNRPPRPVDDSYSVDQDTQLTGNVLANDIDPDGNPMTAVVSTAPSHGTLTLSSDGAFVYTPTAGYSGADSFSYTVADTKGANAIGTVTIAVKYVAPPPVVDQQQPYTVDGVDADTGKITGHFNVTHDKPFTYHLASAPDPALGTFELNEQTGQWTFTPNPRTRVLAGTVEPTSPAAVKLTFAAVATDGEASTAQIVVSEHIAAADRAAVALPTGTVPVLSFVDPRTGDAYVFGYTGGLINSTVDDPASYLAVVIHRDGSSSIPVVGGPVQGLVTDAFVIGDTTFVVSQTGDYDIGYQYHLSPLGPGGLTPVGELPGAVDGPLTVGGATYLVTWTGDYESGYQTQLHTVGPTGVTATTSIPGLVSADRILHVGDVTYLVTGSGTYETGYQTHLTAVGPSGVVSTTSIPGQFHEDSYGYSIVKGDITYLVTRTGTYETGYETNVTAVGPDGVTPTVTIPGWAENDPVVVGDTTYLLVTPYSRIVTHVLALTPTGSTPVGSIPGEVSGDPIVVGDTTYLISHIGDYGATETWQTVVTTLTPTPGGVTVVGDPIPGYRWGVSPIVVDGTTYLVTETWNSSVGYETHLTALRADGVAPLGSAILGTVSGDPQVVVVGDSAYLITTAKYYWNSDGTYAYTRTFLPAVQPDGLPRWGDPLAGYPGAAPITIGDTTYLVMETDDGPTGYQLQLVALTSDGVTPVGAPASGRVNSHNAFDTIVVGGTTYLMVETPDSAGGHQTSLVKVGPGGLTAVPGALPGHPVSNPIVVGDTTYLVTQTGEYQSAQTHFTALSPQGVLQPTYTVVGEVAYEPLLVVGDLTYVKTNEWKQKGDGSHSTDHMYLTALTAAGPVSVDLPTMYGYHTSSVGDTTFLMNTVYPGDPGAVSDTVETYIVVLTPDGPVQPDDPIPGERSGPYVVGDTTYLTFTVYPDDADALDDFTTYVMTLTADGLVVSDPFPEVAVSYLNPIFAAGDTTYVMTTAGIWAVGVDAGQDSRQL